MKISHKLNLAFVMILLMVSAVGVFLVHQMKGQMLESRELKTQHLVDVAYGIIDYHYRQSIEGGGGVSKEIAQANALHELSHLRYDKKEYFWVNDMRPVMIMHPYKTELNGKDLSSFVDPNGKELFMEFVRTVKENNGQGFVDYMWPEPGAPDSAPPVPKVSFVKLFSAWGWIVGSGIYIQDVDLAIQEVVSDILIQLVVVFVVLMAIAFYVSSSIRSSITTIARRLDEDVVSAINKITVEVASLHVFSEKMVRISNDTAGRSQIVSEAAEEAAESSRAVEIATQQLESSISEISRQMEEAKLIVRQASDESGQAGGQVAILSEASQKIGEVVGLITNIASKTNLLALNATIEAARAGESGKGFAVVANEVKILASQTSGATENIGGQIEEIQMATMSAVTAINHIRQTIMKVDEISNIISDAVYEQGSVAKEILRNVNQSAEGTQLVSENILSVSDSADNTKFSAQDIVYSVDVLNVQVDLLRGVVHEFVEQVKSA